MILIRHQSAHFSRAVPGDVGSGRANPDGIHWNFEAHRAVTDLMLKRLAEAGAVSQRTDDIANDDQVS